MIKKCLLTINLVLFTISCASISKNSNESVLTLAESMNGTWLLKCSPENSKDPKGKYVIINDTISNGILSSESKLFEDSCCTVPSVPFTRNLTVKLSVTDGVTKTVFGKAFHINETLVERKYEGRKNNIGVGKTVYDIVFIVEDILYYGRSSTGRSGSSSDKRFVKLFVEAPYIRQ